ncbi:MAG: anti-sigma regulatory factor [Planctomycetes bacterium]|nr:anti-sigma regulatory factor [Planctomycetota bacterium]
MNDIAISISSDQDIVIARQRGRELAAKLGFSSTEQIAIATAISELSRNIVEYAKRGEVILSLTPSQGNGRGSLQITARDRGPGIPDVALAMRDGYSTSRSLGLGLPGTRRLMDEFEIVSKPGKGTTVTIRKWI